MSTNSSLQWGQLVSIYGCGAVSLPVIMIGQEVALQEGWMAALVAILIGNGFLLLLGLAASSMGVGERKSTAELTLQYFGKAGSSVLSLLFVLSMLAWYAIQLNVMSLSLTEAMLSQGYAVPLLCNAAIGLLITFVAQYGARAIGRLADVCMPLLLLTIAGAVFTAEPSSQVLEARLTLFTPVGISLIMAASIGVVIDLPTFFRLAENKRQGTIAVLLTFGLILPLVEGVGIYLAVNNPHASIVEAFRGQGRLFWSAWILIFMLLSGWTVNNSNLYSAAVSTEVVAPRMSFRQRIWLTGMLGTLFACCNPLEHLTVVINLLGVAVGSIGGVLITSYLQKLKGEIANSVCLCTAWSVGLLAGGSTMFSEISLSGVALLDGYIAAAVTALCMNLIAKYRRNDAPIYSRST